MQLILSLAYGQETAYENKLRDWEFQYSNSQVLDGAGLILGGYLYYKNGQFQRSVNLLDQIKIDANWPENYLELLALNELKLGNSSRATQFWSFSPSAKINPIPVAKELIEPAIYLSYIIPGSGLIYEGQYALGLKALAINSILIYGLVESFNNKKYALSFLFLFLEIPFYKGNVKVTKQSVEKRIQQNYMQQLSPWISNVEKAIEQQIELKYPEINF